MKYFNDNIMEAIVTENIFGNLEFLEKEHYRIVGLNENDAIFEQGWEVYLTNILNPRYFLFNPQTEVIHINFAKGDDVYNSLEATISKLKKTSPSFKEKPNGLGDVVEKFAQPIAKTIDAIAGTNIQGCGGCQKRKEYLNKKFPKI